MVIAVQLVAAADQRKRWPLSFALNAETRKTSMQCPRCGNRAIAFADWAKGVNAFRYYCDSCATPLKANTATKLGFVLTLAAAAVSLLIATLLSG